METSTLRWVLIIVGIALLAGLFLFGNPERRTRKPKRRKRKVKTRKMQRTRTGAGPRREPTLGTASENTASAADSEDPTTASGARQGELPIAGESPDTRAPAKPPGPPPEKVITLYLQARDNRMVAGAELLEVCLKSGMVFGEMDIFHRLPPDSQQPIFSLANLTKPGYFDKNAWNTMETKGVTLFMTLPGPVNALDAWDAMLAAGRRFAELLHMDLLDVKREIFTRQREGEIREELRAYERSQLPEA